MEMPKLLRFEANFSSAVERYRQFFLGDLSDTAKFSVGDAMLGKWRAKRDTILPLRTHDLIRDKHSHRTDGPGCK